MTEIHCYIHVTKYSNLVGLFQQRFFSSAQLLASLLDFGRHRCFETFEIYKFDKRWGKPAHSLNEVIARLMN